MSQYTVEFCEDTSFGDVADSCVLMWTQQEYPRKHWKRPWDYYQAVLEDGAQELPSIVCRLDNHFVGGLSIGDLSTDSHMPGKGIIVYNTVVDSEHPKVTRLLYRYLIELIREGGGSWYQTTRRVSEFEFHSKYRRIPHGQKS